MSDLTVRRTGYTFGVGAAATDDRSKRTEGAPTNDGAPPVPTHGAGAPDIPVLDLPRLSLDALGDIAERFLSLKLKTGDLQLEGSMRDIKDRGASLKSRNDEIARKLNEAADKMAEAEKAKTATKVLTWIAVALSIAIAVATGGVGAIIGAAVATTMAILNEAGVMDKLTTAIADSIQKDFPGTDSATAKKWAMGIVIGLSIAVSVGAAGAAFISGGAQIGGLVAKLPDIATKLADKLGTSITTATLRSMAEVAQKAVTGAKVMGALVSLGQAGSNVGGGVQRHSATMLQADVMDDRAFARRLQQRIEDEQELVQQIVEMMSGAVTKVIETMNSQSESAENVIRQMRSQMG
ncbi:MAG: type III secretion system translocon subunit SctE [Acetobacteraceae bacterium]